MIRGIFAAMVAAFICFGAFGTGPASAAPASAVPVSAKAADSCERGDKSVNCDSENDADEYMSKHCAGGGNNIDCPGVGTRCQLQDDGIICAAGDVPSGGVAAGAGGTADRSEPLLLAAGLMVMLAGAWYAAAALRRSRTSEA